MAPQASVPAATVRAPHLAPCLAPYLAPCWVPYLAQAVRMAVSAADLAAVVLGVAAVRAAAWSVRYLVRYLVPYLVWYSAPADLAAAAGRAELSRARHLAQAEAVARVVQAAAVRPARPAPARQVALDVQVDRAVTVATADLAVGSEVVTAKPAGCPALSEIDSEP